MKTLNNWRLFGFDEDNSVYNYLSASSMDDWPCFRTLYVQMMWDIFLYPFPLLKGRFFFWYGGVSLLLSHYDCSRKGWGNCWNKFSLHVSRTQMIYGGLVNVWPLACLVLLLLYCNVPRLSLLILTYLLTCDYVCILGLCLCLQWY